MNQAARTISGFTLMELVLVLMIVAIVAALAAPTLAGFARGRVVADTATRFTALTGFAQSQAKADGQIYRLSIDTDGGTLSITHDDGSGNFVASDASEAAFKLPAGLHVESDAPVVERLHVIEFAPEGRVDPGTVRFSDDFGNAVEVSCDSPLGYYHIVTGPDVAGGGR